MSKTVKETNGYFNMHWDLLRTDDITWDEAFFLEYLMEVYPVLKNKVMIDGREYARLSNSYIQEVIDASPHIIRRWFNALVANGYIFATNRDSKGNECKNGVRYYSINTYVEKRVKDGVNDSVNDSVKKFNTKETNNTNNLSNEDINSNSSPSKNESKFSNEIKEIIDYLNIRTNSKYRYNSESNNEHIRARLNEGFTVEDFKKVIDVKTAEWKNSEMEKYIRPKTLFAPSHFEDYLNQKPANYSKKKEPQDIAKIRGLTEEELRRFKEAKSY